MYDALEFARVRKPLLFISGVAWILLLMQPSSIPVIGHCLVASSGATPSSFLALLTRNNPATLGAGWTLMLIAMMSPVLIAPICHIHSRSFARRRGRSIALFLSGYAAVWMALGSVLVATALTVKSFTREFYLPTAIALFVALVWQFSPIKQRCLNRCHIHPALAAFGTAADFDAFRFGITHAICCAGSCWALMLFPMLLMRGHVAAMAIVTALIFAERLEPPTHPCWRLRGLGKAIRIFAAQTRIRAYGISQDRAFPL